jgi:hypothetical protein
MRRMQSAASRFRFANQQFAARLLCRRRRWHRRFAMWLLSELVGGCCDTTRPSSVLSLSRGCRGGFGRTDQVGFCWGEGDTRNEASWLRAGL